VIFLSLSTELEDARSYSMIGATATAIIGLIIIFVSTVFRIGGLVFTVFGFLSLFSALASHVMVGEKIRTGDVKGARRMALFFSIALFILGLVIGGAFFLQAHSKLGGEKSLYTLDDLERKYARGEITREEFLRLKKHVKER
jgi:uncharacterized membrane protein